MNAKKSPISSQIIATSIVNAAGLTLVGIALYHFFGIYAVVGLAGLVLRFRI